MEGGSRSTSLSHCGAPAHPGNTEQATTHRQLTQLLPLNGEANADRRGLPELSGGFFCLMVIEMQGEETIFPQNCRVYSK